MDESSPSSEDEDEDEEEAEAAPPKKTKRPLKMRTHSQPSESLQQLAPLNLSESRCIDPPAARARIKKAKAAAKVNAEKARKKTVGGPTSESELDETPRTKKKKKSKDKKAKKKKDAAEKKLAKKRPLGRREDEEDEDEEEDEESEPRKKGKKAKKLAKKPLGKRRSRDDEDEDEDEDEEAEEGEEKPRLSPRQQKRRQQLMVLGGSFGALIAVVILFFAINAMSASKKAARDQNFKDAKAKIADAREAARTDVVGAEKAYSAAIAFVNEKQAAGFPDEDELGPDFIKDWKVFQAERDQFKRVSELTAKAASDPANAFDSINEIVGTQNEVIQEIGLKELLKVNDMRCGQVFGSFASSGNARIKATARRGLIQSGGKAALPHLAGIIREENPSSELFKGAAECTLAQGQAPEALDALIALADKDTDPTRLVSLANQLGRILGEPRVEAPLTKLSSNSNLDVQAAAQKALAEVRQFKKG
jgi:hypothetical protein